MVVIAKDALEVNLRESIAAGKRAWRGKTYCVAYTAMMSSHRFDYAIAAAVAVVRIEDWLLGRMSIVSRVDGGQIVQVGHRSVIWTLGSPSYVNRWVTNRIFDPRRHHI